MASGPYLFAAWQCARRPQPDSGKLAAVKHHQITAPQSRNSPVARNCVVELVGLEPTTRVLWNTGVSDQLTLSDTRHSNSKRAAMMGISTKGNFRLPLRREVPGVPHTTAGFFPPNRDRAPTTRSASRSCRA